MITVILKTGSQPPDVSNFEEAATLLSHHLYRINSRPRSWRPPTDIYETDDQFIVLVEVAGMYEEDFAVSIEGNILTINGTRNSPIEERRAFHQMEIPFGDFITQIELPAAIDTEKIDAAYENGFLRINLPKEKPKRIEINRD